MLTKIPFVDSMTLFKLRRSVAAYPQTEHDWQKLVYLDLNHSSNHDIAALTRALKKGKFRHPRARQMAAAARNGWVITISDAFVPGDWNERVRQILNPSSDSDSRAPPAAEP